ncbi:hypothetical protein TNIN_383001 [Trichonephila inaurata madagascariensis]|uniref:Uncharacterized protein n=1 Tax=Trichonephila inaurata madagascariensis TaxID=2747483 RepID=A0A8X6XJR4_9ARAC|nr:hypothetical protein TNIN_383001 [Trichonephila inaurata madagascariensis]
MEQPVDDQGFKMGTLWAPPMPMPDEQCCLKLKSDKEIRIFFRPEGLYFGDVRNLKSIPAQPREKSETGKPNRGPFMTRSKELEGDFNAKHTSWGCPYVTPEEIDFKKIVRIALMSSHPPPLRFGTASLILIMPPIKKPELALPLTQSPNSALTIIRSSYTSHNS